MATIEINGLIFTKIKLASKRGQQIIRSYNNSTVYALRHVYKSYSAEKESAYNDCLQVMRAVNGSCLKITGANCNFFSVAFYTESEGKHYLIYITHAGQYAVTLYNEGF